MKQEFLLNLKSNFISYSFGYFDFIFELFLKYLAYILPGNLLADILKSYSIVLHSKYIYCTSIVIFTFM